MDYPMVVIDREQAVSDATIRRAIVMQLRTANILREGADFGVVPGTTKPTLLKPGAERLCAALRLDPDFEIINRIERWDADSPLFYYQYKCRLLHVDTRLEVATGIGSCNSMEAKYRWRKAERKCPVCGKAAIIKGRAEYGGGWVCFGKKGGCNAKFADSAPEIISQPDGNVPNEDVFSIVNTIDKMAQKRALIAAVLIGANASEFFTQDVEDMPGFGLVEEAEIVSITAKNAEPLPTASGAQWSADEAQAWAAELEKRGVSKPQLFAALGIRERYGEWAGSLDSAKARFDAWVKQQ